MNPLFAVMTNQPSRCAASRCDYSTNKTESPFETPVELPGMHSDNNIVPSQVKSVYVDYVIRNGLYQATPLSEAMLETVNIEYIRQAIENNIKNYIKDDNIKFLLTKEFAQTVMDVIQNNQWLAYDVRVGLPFLNSVIIHRETEIALLSERQRMRFIRWGLENDRSRFMPYGLGDKTQHRKGETFVTSAGYSLNHPFKSQYRAYLRDVLQVNCPPPSSKPCEIVPVPPSMKFANP